MHPPALPRCLSLPLAAGYAIHGHMSGGLRPAWSPAQGQAGLGLTQAALALDASQTGERAGILGSGHGLVALPRVHRLLLHGHARRDADEDTHRHRHTYHDS